MHLIHEHFNNINELIKTVYNRPNNSVMKDAHSSIKKSDGSWEGTKSWEEAIELLKFGYTDILPNIKKNMRVNSKKYKNYFFSEQRKIVNMPMGYIPNIPNSIMNLPNSMIFIESTPIKTKTISIIYKIGGSAFESADMFIKAGTSLLTAINIIEKQGIQVKLSICFFGTREDEEVVFPTVSVKNYGQKLDLQKLCFPIAHPSMFRRIGFKYLETCPKITNKGWSFGYGNPNIDLLKIKKELNINDNVFLLDCRTIRDNNYDVKKILESFEII